MGVMIPPQVPRSKRLLSDSDSNILIMMTGHGGEDFLKFQVESTSRDSLVLLYVSPRLSSSDLSHVMTPTPKIMRVGAISHRRYLHVDVWQSGAVSTEDMVCCLQDAEEILSKDIADAFAQMHMKKRYNEILFIADTCQAASLFAEVRFACDWIIILHHPYGSSLCQ